MLALACVAEGMSTYDAAARAGLDHWSITKRIKRFQTEGFAAFQDRKIGGRPLKLDAAQLQELRIEILKRQQMSYGQLRDLVWARFRVRYSLSSLRRLVKRQLPTG
jgi:transposase